MLIVRVADTLGCFALSLIMGRMLWIIAQNESQTEEAREHDHGPVSCWFMIVTFCGLMFLGLIGIWKVWTT